MSQAYSDPKRASELESDHVHDYASGCIEGCGWMTVPEYRAKKLAEAEALADAQEGSGE